MEKVNKSDDQATDVRRSNILIVSTGKLTWFNKIQGARIPDCGDMIKSIKESQLSKRTIRMVHLN